MKSALCFVFACAAAPLFAQTPELILDASGIPVNANYTALNTGNASRGRITGTQSTWVNYATSGNVGYTGSRDGLAMINGTTLYHAKLTTGTLSGTSGIDAVFTPNNSGIMVINGDFTTASVFFANGRYQPSVSGRFINAGPVYACGGQIYFSAAETIANPFFLGTSTYMEGNTYSNSALRVDTDLTLNGKTTILTPAQITFGDSKTLTLADLDGPADLALISYSGINTLLVNAISGYTGILRPQTNTRISFGSAVTQAPGITLAGGAFRPLTPITLGAQTTLTAGILNLDAFLPGATPILTVPAGAALDFTGSTLNFGTPPAFPATFKVFAADSEAGITGWNLGSIAITFNGSANPLITPALNADGTITFTATTSPVTFTAPSDYWTDSKTFPTQAATLDNVTATQSFGLNAAFMQTIDGTPSTVAQVTGGGGSSIQLFGLHQYGYGNGSTVTRDIWLKTSGGAFALVAGGCENNWLSSQCSPIAGDILVELAGNAIVTNVVGGSIKGGNGNIDGAPGAGVTGNIGIMIQDNAIVTGTIVGANTCAHNQSPVLAGNTAITITSMQPENAGSLDNLPGGLIIGGGAWTANSSSNSRVEGNTAITIDLPAEASGTFAKGIYGGNYVNVNPSAGMPRSDVTGSATITVSTPDSVTFTNNIYGASRSVAGVNVSVGSTAVTINGGTYTCAIVGGGSAASVAIENDAVVTLNGGVYSGARIRGTVDGAVGGQKKLIIGGNIDLADSSIIDFDTITIAQGKALTVGANVPTAFPAFTGTVKGLTRAAGQSVAPGSESILEDFTLDGGSIIHEVPFTCTGATAFTSGTITLTPLTAGTPAFINTGAMTFGSGIIIEIGDLLAGTYTLVENQGGTIDITAISIANFTRRGLPMASGISLALNAEGSAILTFAGGHPYALGWRQGISAWKTSTTDPDPGYAWDILVDRTPSGNTAPFMVEDTAYFLENGITDPITAIAIEGAVEPNGITIAPGEGNAYSFIGSGTIGGTGGLTLESGQAILNSAHTYTGPTRLEEGTTLTYTPEGGFTSDFDRTITGSGTVEIPFTTANYASTFKIGTNFSGTVRVTAGNFTLNTSAISNGTLAMAGGVNGQYAASMNLGRPFIFEGNNELHANQSTDSTLTGILKGIGFTKKGSGILRVKDSASHALTGTVTADAGTFWWGTGTGAAAGQTRTLGSELAINTGAFTYLHLWTTSANTTATTDKVNVATPIRFNGGTLYSEDGSYYFSQGFDINGSGTFQARWTKGWVVNGLRGRGTFNLQRISSTDNNFSTFTLTGAGGFTGTIALSSNDGNAGHGMTLNLGSANAAASAIINTGAQAARTRLTIGTAAATIGGLTGSAPVALNGVTGATLTIANTADCAFSGTIDTPIAIVKTGAGALTLNTQTYANAITVQQGAAFGGSGIFTGTVAFSQGAKLAAAPSTDATGIPTFSGTVTGQAQIILPEDFPGTPNTAYYIAKGSAITKASFLKPQGFSLAADATGVYIINRVGVHISLY